MAFFAVSSVVCSLTARTHMMARADEMFVTPILPAKPLITSTMRFVSFTDSPASFTLSARPALTASVAQSTVRSNVAFRRAWPDAGSQPSPSADSGTGRRGRLGHR